MDETPENEPEREAPAELPQDVADRQRKRERLRAYLKEHHPPYLNWYLGALYTAGDLKNPDRLRQAAHSLRDLSIRVVHDLLPEALVAKIKDDKAKRKSSDNRFVEQIELAVAGATAASEISPAVRPHLQALARQWAVVHGRLVAIAHAGTDDPDELGSLIEEFEDVLWAAFQATPDRVASIDAYLAIERPDPKTLKELLRLITQPAAQEYFFDRLERPGWLAPLMKAGAFAKPPGAIRKDKTIQFPGWAAIKYLERVAPASPASIVTVVQQLGGIDNPHVMGQLVAILMKVPIVEAAKAVPTVVQWLQQPFQLFVHYNATKLFDHFVANKAWKSAMALMRGFTSISKNARRPGSSKLLSPEAKAFVDDYEYEELLAKHLPPLIAEMPYDVFRLLERRLEDALAIEKKMEGKGRARRTSHWRPTIEESRHNLRHEAVRDSLVSGLRDTLAVLGGADEANFRVALKRLMARKNWIFKRLAIDAIRVHRKVVPDLAEQLLKKVPILSSKHAYFELYHEYHKFFSEAVGDLSPEEREKVLDNLSKKLNYAWDGKKNDDRAALDLRRLLVGVAAHLPKGTKYGDMLDQMNGVLLGIGMDPSVFSEVSVGWVGPQSPVAQDDLGKMALGDIIALLKSFVGGPQFQAPTAEGLGRVLGNAVQADPKKFMDGLASFKDPDLNPLYLQHLLRGLHDAVKEKKRIDWAAFLDLAADLATRKAGQNPAIKDPEHDYEGVYADIARLLELGFEKDRENLTVAQAEVGRDIILRMIAHPVGVIERRYEDGDATSASINTFHGQALHALNCYLMFRWSLLSPGGTLRPVAGVRELFSAEIQASLDKLLASKDVTPAMHAALGWHFPVIKLMAPDWAATNEAAIFNVTVPKLWEAAWDGYITFNIVYPDLLPQFRKHYERAIETMPERETSQRMDKESLNHLAQHLLIAKVHGLSFGDGPDLLMAFYEKAPLAQREHAAWFLGRRCLEADTQKPRYWNALKPVIEARITWAETIKDPAIIGSEIAALAHALEFAPWPLTEISGLLSRCFPFLRGGRHVEDVVRFLCRRATEEPLAALELLEELFRTRLRDIELWSSEAAIRSTLVVAKASADQAVRGKATAIATIFFDAGYIAYRDLI